MRKGLPLMFTTAPKLLSSQRCFQISRGYITVADIQRQSNGNLHMFYDKSMTPISPWHQISLKAEGNQDLYNMIVEIPKFTTAKMEINTKMQHNPIVQDVKNGLPRSYHGPIYWNYGAFPQTWEDPTIRAGAELESAFGDNDPIDVVEVGSSLPAPTVGEVLRVKIIGGLALIDQNELDWKILAIREGDSLFDVVHDVDDLENHSKGVISGIREWFRWYKTPDNKPLNKFGLNERAITATEAKKVVDETGEHYKALMNGKTQNNGKLWIDCGSNSDKRF